MLTPQMLEGWRQSRSHLVPSLDLTPKNAAFSQIRAELDLLREHRIKQAERTMKFNSDRLRQDSKHAFSHGMAKAQFNHHH